MGGPSYQVSKEASFEDGFGLAKSFHEKRRSRKLAHDQNSNLAHYPRLCVTKETPGATKTREAREPRASESLTDELIGRSRPD
jgi:hypothetical protein